jgi:hypothetical protein
VPPRCDCTDIVIQGDDPASNTNGTTTTSDNNNNTNAINAIGHFHGVQEHHGAAYPTTASQDVLLNELTKLTKWDQRLYELAQNLFWERLIETEHEYGVKICDDLRTDIGFDGLPE